MVMGSCTVISGCSSPSSFEPVSGAVAGSFSHSSARNTMSGARMVVTWAKRKVNIGVNEVALRPVRPSFPS